MDDNVVAILQFNSFIYKIYAFEIMNKKNVEFIDLMVLYGLFVYAFSIDLLTL